MNCPITLSYILEMNNVSPKIIYDLTVEGLEIEQCKLQTNAATYNATGYHQSLQKIQQYHRVLSIFRGDTLNAIAGWKQSSN